jgi:SAM-dependent methyltransferase
MNTRLKKLLIRVNWILSTQIGLSPRLFLLFFGRLPTYFLDRKKFLKRYKGKTSFMPCLHDRYEEAGVTNSEYFWQDLLVARWIYKAGPEKHVDVGSRIDGFVAHVASFREVEVFDVREISHVIPNIVFRQADLMNSSSLPRVDGEGYCDSLSCLHALEHFGLGRYGDDINPTGYRLGLENMSKLLRTGGKFYLSVPIGVECVEFNANWIFNPKLIIDIAAINGLVLQSLTIYSHADGVIELEPSAVTIDELARQQYNLGIFVFLKTPDFMTNKGEVCVTFT